MNAGVLSRRLGLVLLLVTLSFPFRNVLGQGTAFTYQGRLSASGSPANGSYDLTFTLFTTNNGGIPAAATATNSATAISNGLFVVILDFGAGVFNGAGYWLEIGVATNGAGAFTTLTPRQLLTPTPYAIYSAEAANVASISAAHIVGIIPLTNLSTNVALLNSNASFSAAVTVGGTNSIAPLTVPPRATGPVIGSLALNVQPNALALAGRYAYLVGTWNGPPTSTNKFALQIVDVSDPAAPVLVGSTRAISGSSSTPRSVALAGRFAYVTDSTLGTLEIFDVSNPSAPTGVGTVNTGGHPGPVAAAGHYIYAYVVSSTGTNELQIYDVSNPSSPLKVGAVLTDNLSYSANSLAVEGRYVYVVNPSTGTNDSMQIIDVSNPAAPITVSFASTGTNNSPHAVAVSGRYAYVLSQARNTMVTFDVKNPSAPAILGSVPTASYPMTVSVAGRYAYVTSLLSHSLQTFDISNPAVPVPVGVASGTGGYACGEVSGRYAYIGDTFGSTLQIFDLGGAYIQQLEAGTVETGTLQTRDAVAFGNELDVRGGLTVGGSAQIVGGLGLSGGLNVNSNLLFLAGGGTNVGIGTTNPAYTLQVNGSVAGVGAYVNVSDARYKTNIQSLAHALEKILAIRGVSYDWRASEFPAMRFDKGTQLGFIAQEIKETLPEVVSQDAAGHYAIAYSKLIPVLVEAIKEQQKDLQTKDAEFQALKARFDRFEKAFSRAD